MRKLRRICVALLVLVHFWPGALSAKEKQTHSDGLVFTGRYTLRMQVNGVEGSLQQYRLDTDLEPGARLTQSLALSAFGPLDGGWYLNGRYDASRVEAERLELRVNKAANELFAGTRRFTAPSPGLLQWGRLLTGVQASLVADDAGRFGLRAAFGDPLGIPAKEELAGKGLVGPYLLAAHHIPVVEESETVYVDGIIQNRDTDYEIDYELGGITFRAPVPESSNIVVEYEYVAPQPRRTSALLGRWKEGNVTFDVLAGYEHAIAAGDENPLEFIPPGDPGTEELPTWQHMEGVGVTWAVNKALSITGSWLSTTADTLGQKDSTAAWQTSGEWRGSKGKAGWDWRVIPSGFRIIGKSAEEEGYRILSAGYEYRLNNLWHSKLNLAWKQPSWQTTPVSTSTAHGQMEHVLTYMRKAGSLGWSLGFVQDDVQPSKYKALTTGVLGMTSVGVINLEAEQRGVVASQGIPKVGEALSLSRVALNLAEKSPVSGTLQWKSEVKHNTNGADNSAVWRATLASKGSNKAGTVLVNGPSWRLQWLSSEDDTHVSETEREVSKLAYARAEAAMPLGRSSFSTDMLVEARQRVVGFDRSVDNYVQAGLRYSKGVQWNLNTAMEQVLPGMEQPWRQQLSAGANLAVPFLRAWTYETNWQVYDEVEAGTQVVGAKQIQGLSWHNATWRIGTDWTTGLLADPASPGDDDEDEDEVKPPLSQVPIGQRFGLNVARVTKNTRFSAQVARDIEPAAGAWRGDLQLTIKTGVADITAELNSVERRGDGIWSLRQHGKIGAQWWVGNTLFSVYGRSDVRLGEEGIGDYRSNGVFTQWTARF